MMIMGEKKVGMCVYWRLGRRPGGGGGKLTVFMTDIALLYEQLASSV